MPLVIREVVGFQGARLRKEKLEVEYCPETVSEKPRGECGPETVKSALSGSRERGFGPESGRGPCQNVVMRSRLGFVDLLAVRFGTGEKDRHVLLPVGGSSGLGLGPRVRWEQ